MIALWVDLILLLWEERIGPLEGYATQNGCRNDDDSSCETLHTSLSSLDHE